MSGMSRRRARHHRSPPVVATQSGCRWSPGPITSSPKQIGIAPEEVMARLARLLESGVIRRIGAVPNHYAIGYTANGMSVWDVPDERIDELGVRVGGLDFVTHCYHRPRGCRNGLTTCLPWCMAVRAPRCWPRWRASPRFSGRLPRARRTVFDRHSQEDRPARSSFELSAGLAAIITRSV
jgi:hypothetical protein